jgi:hypothetical protein
MVHFEDKLKNKIIIAAINWEEEHAYYYFEVIM